MNKIKNVLLVYMKPSSEKERQSFSNIKKILEKLKINFKECERSKQTKKHFKNKDLVVVVGGDGTFLRTSHFIEDKTPVLGVNSNPEKKEGFFMCCNKNNFEKKLDSFLKNKSKKIKLSRLEAKINNKRIDLALNELFVGPIKPYKVSFYDLKLGKKQEHQKSSGIIIGTASGSNAWLKSAGGRRLFLSSRKFQFVVREPYSRKLTNIKLKKKVLSPKTTLEITSKKDDNIVVVDSLSPEYKFKKESILRINVSDKLLNVIK
ncbi:NAD(+)/NADH kinase [Candidatus Woesearchaeota archaeon]|nr:NAD(+)/NADH kinase [Candidatus Woesearchaeota archaeon]